MVLGNGLEEILEQRSGGIKDGGTLLEVGKLGRDLEGLCVTAVGEVDIAEKGSELVGLVLVTRASEKGGETNMLCRHLYLRAPNAYFQFASRPWGLGDIPCGHRSWQ